MGSLTRILSSYNVNPVNSNSIRRALGELFTVIAFEIIALNVIDRTETRTKITRHV